MPGKLSRKRQRANLIYQMESTRESISLGIVLAIGFSCICWGNLYAGKVDPAAMALAGIFPLVIWSGVLLECCRYRTKSRKLRELSKNLAKGQKKTLQNRPG